MVFGDYFPWIVANIGGAKTYSRPPLRILGGGGVAPPVTPRFQRQWTTLKGSVVKIEILGFQDPLYICTTHTCCTTVLWRPLSRPCCAWCSATLLKCDVMWRHLWRHVAVRETAEGRVVTGSWRLLKQVIFMRMIQSNEIKPFLTLINVIFDLDLSNLWPWPMQHSTYLSCWFFQMNRQTTMYKSPVA